MGHRAIAAMCFVFVASNPKPLMFALVELYW
jgi:hypothetical protein